MYTTEQEEQALTEFEETGSATLTVRKLGYPSLSTLYRWLEHKKADIENNHGHTTAFVIERSYHGSPEEHPRYPSAQCKLDLMPPSKAIARKAEALSKQQGELPKSTVLELQEQVNDMQPEIDILKETLNVLKNDSGVDMTALCKSEKLQLVDALKATYPLKRLLMKLHIPRSSYYYQKKVQSLPYKYAFLQENIITVFSENRSCYGYRRMYAALKARGTRVSEKVIRKIMAKCGLTVYCPSRKKYSSYQGKIDTDAKNLISRDFHATAPNEKRLSL